MSLSRCGSGGEALTRTLFDGARIIAEIWIRTDDAGSVQFRRRWIGRMRIEGGGMSRSRRQESVEFQTHVTAKSMGDDTRTGEVAVALLPIKANGVVQTLTERNPSQPLVMRADMLEM
jgi:hypothetical protein